MRKLLYLVIIFLLLCGCSAQAQSNDSSKDPLVAKITISKETIQVGDKVEFGLTVSKGGENVIKLNEAYYELVSVDKKSKLEKKEFKENKDGVYSFVEEFDKEGRYHLKYHVSKGEQFFEETTTIQVGSKGDTEESHEHSGESTDEAEDHATSSEEQEISTHLMYDPATSKLLVHVSEGSAFLKEARVRFEIWNEETEDKHTYLETVEKQEGEYVHQLEDEYEGLYKVNIHVEKGKIHYHKEEEVSF